MSLLTARTTPITKTTHTTAIAAGMVALPIAALLVAAYGSAVVHGVARAFSTVFLHVATGGSKIADLSVDVAFTAIVGVIVVAISLAVREYRADEDKELHDIR